ncbi:MAG TPA: HIRAN domain-containing protein [Rhodocyclaceae bacterium]|nr:HIRAN domain-containing protein [Rhodocyclaceae bacterium]
MSARPIRPASAVAVLALLVLAFAASAQTVKVLVQSSPLAGFQYHEAPVLWDEMKVGDPLVLVREPANAFDANAVRVEWRGRMIGYLPRAENRAVAAEMDRGGRVEGRIARLREHRNPWARVLIEVFVVL